MDIILIELTEKLASERGDPSVPRDYIVEAMERIREGEFDVERYLTGAPSLKSVHEVARRLYEEK